MSDFQYLMQGFVTVLTIQNILAVIGGSIMGLVLGAMPGIGALAGIAMLLPLTFAFEPTTGIIMLSAMYFSNMFGGSFSAILLNIPGTPSAVMTALDGHPMATNGRPGQALFTCNLASFFGGTIGMIILVFSAVWLSEVGLMFGPTEMAALMLIAMTSITWLVGKNPSKGLVVTCLGMLTTTIGMDTVTGSARYTFGNLYLLGGIDFIPVTIGLVGFATVIELMATRHEATKIHADKLTIRGSLLSRDEVKRLFLPSIRSGLLGTFIGILPGAGATASSFMCYGIQKKFKNEVPLGEGAVEGLAAAESANNAAAAGSFAPLLALGIPGSGTGAVLLGGLMMWGLNPGPMLFTNEPEFVWSLIASLFVANLITLAIAFAVIPYLIRILKIPTHLMIPIITVVCFVGSYSANSSTFDMLIMVVCGVIGYFLRMYKFPTAPFVLSMVLTSLLEVNLRRSFQIADSGFLIFFERPISAVLTVIFLAIMLAPVCRGIAGMFKKQAV